MSVWGWVRRRAEGTTDIASSLSMEETANERWRRIIDSRYAGLATLAIGAAAIPLLRENRWWLVAYIVLVGFPYNWLVGRMVTRRASAGRWVPITDAVLVVLIVPINDETVLPVCLVIVAVVALGTITLGRREPASATLVAVGLLVLVHLVVGLPGGWLAPVSVAVACILILLAVAEVTTAEREVRSKLVALVDGLDAVVWTRCPRTFAYDFVSTQAADLLGVRRDEWIEPGFWATRVHPDDVEQVRVKTADALQRNADHELRYRMVTPDGRVVHVHDLVSIVPAGAGRPVWSQGITVDETDAAVAEQELRHLALHDGLTGLPNRFQLDTRLRTLIAQREADGPRVALLVMDLDQFKEVNDALGHHVGDRLLVALADRLRDLRDDALVARLGGDEFAVVVEGVTDVAEAEALADEVRSRLETPFEVDDVRLQIDASVGVALCPDHASDAATLVQRADVAMYVAKRTATGHAVYQADLDRSSVRRLHMLSDLRAALDERQLELYFQPVVDVRSGEVVRAEALVRWNHPQLGFLPPDEFIELAELSGAIHPLTRWVLAEAVDTAVRLRSAGHPIGVAANISVRNLYDADLAADVEALLRTAGLPASELMVELTETELVDDPRLAVEAFSGLAGLGVGTAIDDFGTGYSSLAYLRELPVREIKVDRSFVTGMSSRADDITIVRSMIDLGHNLGLQVVAEGVEDPADRALLEQLGCDLAQGYLVSPPLPDAELLAWLDRQRAPLTAHGEPAKASAEM